MNPFPDSLWPRWLRGGALAALLAWPAAVGPTASAAESVSDLPPVRTQPASGVWRVKNKPEIPGATNTCRAGVNDYLSLDVINFEDWRRTVKTQRQADDLVLFLDGEALPGLRVKFFNEWAEPFWDAGRKQFTTNRVASYGVKLEQDGANAAVWKRLARGAGFEKAAEVSLGYEDAPPMNTWVYPLPGDQPSPFVLRIMSRSNMWLGLVVIIGAFLLFVMLARKTDILRDPHLPLRPDETRPFSLARAQMAFWFFLVIGSFFFLWLISGDTGTLNSSTIALIGISAATAVSSAFIDSGRRQHLYQEVVPREVRAKGREEMLAQLETDLAATDAEINAHQQAADAAELAGKPADGAGLRRLEALIGKRQRLERQLEFFQATLWKAAAHDLLGENGTVSFHRFQMCVWTVVLGIIFVAEVYNRTAMPEFSGTLLALMGVSAGTFIGFKIPEQAKG